MAGVSVLGLLVGRGFMKNILSRMVLTRSFAFEVFEFVFFILESVLNF
jgi:hypothetical protein